jgi:hypothetical protein
VKKPVERGPWSMAINLLSAARQVAERFGNPGAGV